MPVKTNDEILKQFEILQNNIENIRSNNNIDLDDCNKIEHKPFFTNDILDNICEDVKINEDIIEFINYDDIPSLPDSKEIERCINSIQSVTDNSIKNVGYLDRTRSAIFGLEELLNNTEMLYYYHKERYDKYYLIKKNKIQFNPDISLFSKINNTISSIKTQLSDYSSLIDYNSYSSGFNILESKLSGSNIFEFTFNFIKRNDLLNLKIDDDPKLTNKISKYDSYNKEILNSISDIKYTIDNKKLKKGEKLKGLLYTDFYNKMENPIENFFTLEERGLTKNIRYASIIDTSKTPEAKNIIEVKSSSNTYYVQDFSKYEEFYLNFSKILDTRLSNYFIKNIKPTKDLIIDSFKNLANLEVKYFLFNTQSSATPVAINYSKNFISKYENFLNILSDIKSEQINLNEKLSQKSIMKSLQDCKCIDKFDDTVIEPIIDMVGSFLLSTGTDSENPNPSKHCYWNLFAKLATKYGLLPFPDINNTRSMRYWAVGLKIPTPTKIINIPLPTIWIPLVTISSPMGILVLFIGQIGILPCPYLLWISNNGTKRFIVGLRGQSDPFGFSVDDMSNFPNKNFMVPITSTIKDLKNLSLDDVIKIDLNNQKKNGNLNFSDELDNMKNIVLKSIDRIQFPELSTNISINKDIVIESITNYINNIDLPKITVPKNIDAFKRPSNEIESIISEFKNLMSIKPNVDTENFINLKKIIISKIDGLLDNKNVNDLLLNLPDNIKFDNDNIDDFNKFKNIMKLIIEQAIFSININSIYSDGIFDSISNIDVSVYNCKTIFGVEIDNSLSTIKNAASGIYVIIDLLSLDDINRLFGSLEISRGQVISFINKYIDIMVPDIILPTDFSISFTKLFQQFMKVSIPMVNIKINDIINSFLPDFVPIIVDLNSLKKKLIDSIIPYIESNIDNYNNITSLELKQIVLSLVNNFFNISNISIISIQNTFNSIISTLNLLKSIKDMKIEFNTIDLIANSKEIMIKLRKTISDAKKSMQDCILNPESNCNDLMVVDEILLAIAIESLKKLEIIHYAAVGSVCAFGGVNSKNSFRIIHPLIVCDDLPPFERLTLNNSLFVLFLDEFCYEAKKIGGFQEEFI